MLTEADDTTFGGGGGEKNHNTIKVFVQVSDACRQTLPGMHLMLAEFEEKRKKKQPIDIKLSLDLIS